MKIAIASGKGGTGKTTIATALAQALSVADYSVSLLDCDVEAPNSHIFIQPDLNQFEEVNLLIPSVDPEICNGCGKCAEVCQFHAIVVIGGETLVFPELCHGCGSCTWVCPEHAITEIPNRLGILEGGLSKQGIRFGHGILNIGEPMAVPVITTLKNWQNLMDEEVVVIDSPPGASCPVVESLRGSDYIILVTEPTPFGLHDLKQAYQVSQKLGIPAGVIINRAGIGDTGVEQYCEEKGLHILMQIPLERKIGEGIARGKSLIDIIPAYESKLQQLYHQIKEDLSILDSQ
jgi:MinD superfamily P-loop ATPase